MTFTSDVQKLEIDGALRLFELDASKYGGPVFRFHGITGWSDFDIINSFGTTDPSALSTVRDNLTIIWQGNEYSAIPIDVGNISIDSSGKASSVTFTVSNTIDDVKGAFGAYCRLFNDFIGCRLTIINTFAKYLDAANFPTGNLTAANEANLQKWIVNHRTSENILQISFDMTDPANHSGFKIPTRDITSYCHWALLGDYRSGEGCGYTGAAMFDENDNPVDDPALDRCGARFNSCKIRYANEPMDFGGFVSSNLIKR
ncbi:MAG: phage minor tail protein L [Acinetobacter sp.]